MGDRERRQSQFDRERGHYDYRDEPYYRGQNQPRGGRYGEERENYPRYYQDEGYRDHYARNRGAFESYGEQNWDRDRDYYESAYPSYAPERERHYARNTLRGAYGMGHGEDPYARSWTQYRNPDDYRGSQRGRSDESFGQQLRDAGHQIARKVKRAFRGPKGYKRSDDRIREDVNDRLSQQDDFDPTEIEVSVANAEVTLTGTVASRHEKFLAEEIADDVSGVTEVHNQLRVRRESGTTTTSTQQVGGSEAARTRNARA